MNSNFPGFTGWFSQFSPILVLACALLIMSVASPVRAASLADINAALADMGDLSGQFVQSSPGGETLQGDFFLALPDRFRFVYTQGRAQGGQNVVTLRGNWLVVQEFQGAEANRYPVSATPLHLLVEGRSLHIQPSQLEALTEKGGSIEVALRDPEGDVPGRLVLIFDSKTLALQGWRLLDIQQQRSTVWLHNVTRHARLAEDNFRIDESIAEAEDE
jgi:outer membrane lipoprotein-sorting protein